MKNPTRTTKEIIISLAGGIRLPGVTGLNVMVVMENFFVLQIGSQLMALLVLSKSGMESVVESKILKFIG